MTTSKQSNDDNLRNSSQREGVMDEKQCETLSSEKGKQEVGAVRCDQSGNTGPEKGADPVERADQEGGPRGELLAEAARKKRETEEDVSA